MLRSLLDFIHYIRITIIVECTYAVLIIGFQNASKIPFVYTILQGIGMS